MSRILLADDNPQALRLGEQILRSQGLEVVSVTDGAVALRRLADVDPDLVIVDVFLPSKSGFDIARFMRSQEQYRSLPIIFAAAPADRFEEQDARNAGADLVLKKPFEASVLCAAIQPLLERSRGTRSLGGKQSGIDRNNLRAAITLALDAAMPAIVEELTERVLMVMTAQHSR